MRITQPEPVRRVYCDDCGKLLDNGYHTIVYETGERSDYCSTDYYKRYPIRRTFAMYEIKYQPFF